MSVATLLIQVIFHLKVWNKLQAICLVHQSSAQLLFAVKEDLHDSNCLARAT